MEKASHLSFHPESVGLPKYKHNDITATFYDSLGGVTTRSVAIMKANGYWLMAVIQGDGTEAALAVVGFA